MPFINLRDTPIRLPAGQLRIGRGRGVEISLPAAPSHVPTLGEGVAGGLANGTADSGNRQGQFALLVVDASGSATLSKLTEEAPVYLNSVPAGLEPTPLLHGDRMEIDGIELRFSDDRQTGATAEFPALSPDQAELLPLPPRPVAGTAIRGAAGQSARVGASVKNGRLISLVDGREYAVREDGLAIGRDAACDVVVPANSVSRRHARIALEMRGYTITDNSTNGVTVGGERVRSTRLLRRGDIVRVGPEEFRFYEEQVAADPTPPAPSPPLRIETPLPTPDLERPKAPVLATFVLSNQGAERGKVFEVSSLLTHIGRGDHNDIVLDDDSVSDSHAKLQRRDNRWILNDLDSTNGTYAGGERLTGEVELRGDTEIRFGGAKFVFKPARLAKTPSGGTRVVAAYNKKRTPTPSEPVPVVGADAPAPGEDEGPDDSKRSLAILWIALVGVLALTVSVILRALL